MENAIKLDFSTLNPKTIYEFENDSPAGVIIATQDSQIQTHNFVANYTFFDKKEYIGFKESVERMLGDNEVGVLINDNSFPGENSLLEYGKRLFFVKLIL